MKHVKNSLLVGMLIVTFLFSEVASASPAWGNKTWKIVPSPNPSPSINRLYGVAATATTDVWTVGEYFDEAKGITKMVN